MEGEQPYDPSPLNRATSFAQPQDTETIKWKVDPEEVIDEIVHYLRGDSWNNITNEWIYNQDKDRQLCNDKGLNVFSTHLRGVLNKNIILSNFSEDDIKILAKENAENIAKLIFMCCEEFGIKKQNFDVILQLIDNNVFSSLLRAKNGFFVHHLSTTQRHIEQQTSFISESEKKQPGALATVFGGWKK